MTLRRLIPSIAALVAALAVAVPAAAAGFNPGEFQVSVAPAAGESGGTKPQCDPPMSQLMIELMAGSAVDATCTMNNSASGEKAEGTVANAKLAADDPGFADGTITMTCDRAQTMAMRIRITPGAMMPTLRSMTGTMYKMCVFHMAFPDAASSTLDGTVEMNAKADSKDGDESGQSIEITMDAKVYIVDGTGAFDGYAGEGAFSSTQNVPLGLKGGGGSGGATDAEQAVCDAAPGAPSCTSSVVDSICGQAMWRGMDDHDALCTAAGRRLWLTRAAVRAGDGSPMTMRLAKRAGSARILLPKPKKGLAKVTDATAKLRLVATAGATCTVRANDGAVVGSGTAVKASKAVVVKVKRDSLDSATSLRAYCKLGGKRFTSQKVAVR